jgi:hypothetical protein
VRASVHRDQPGRHRCGSAHRTDDPDGVLERSACGFGSSANGITITLLKTGTYTVMVFDGSSDEMGTYAILLDHADATGARTDVRRPYRLHLAGLRR